MYISHEIRTPLSNVNFGFQLIKMQLDKLDILLEEEGILNSISEATCTPINSRSPSPDLASISVASMSVAPNSVTSSSRTAGAADSMRTTTRSAAVGEEGKGQDMKRQSRHEDIKTSFRELDTISSDSAHSVEVAISILNDLLNYEKLQANVLEMFKDVVPCALVKTVIDEFHVEASYFKVRLSFKTRMSFDAQAKTVMLADKQKLSQVIRNFVSNALKFTPEGGSVTVTSAINPLEEGQEPVIKTAEDGFRYVKCGVLHVNVRDTG